MNAKLSNFTSRVKTNSPTIIAAVSTTALAAYALYVNKTNSNSIRVRVTPSAKKAYEDGRLTNWTSENKEYKFEINQM